MAKVQQDSAAAAPARSPARSLRIPITNVWDGSAWSAKLRVGAGGAVANVMLDTGSSTLAMESSVYDGTDDAALMVTSLAQLITYGGGGFAGPVVTTDVSFGEGPKSSPGALVLKDTSIAIAVVQQGSLGGVNGVMGLAYGGENPAWDLASYLSSKGLPMATFPWPFGVGDWNGFLGEFQAIVQPLQPQAVSPCLDELVARGLVADRFAFYALRSTVSTRMGGDPASQARDPLNNGVFVLGGGEEEDDLYEGDFVSVAVVHDVFYNVSLSSVRVGGGAPVKAAPLQPAYEASLVSNALIDSGSDHLRLAADVYQAVLAGLSAANPAFGQIVQKALSGQPVALAALDLAAWPDIVFTLSDLTGEDVALTVAPTTYWQSDSPAPGQASFRITGPLSEVNQSNLGLPLLNNYYTVFDRGAGAQGVIRFAPIKPSVPGS
ncbi:MAG TPA: pepsin-like aspartic protease [Caulobacteraceae bacterium]